MCVCAPEHIKKKKKSASYTYMYIPKQKTILKLKDHTHKSKKSIVKRTLGGSGNKYPFIVKHNTFIVS